MLRYNNSRQQFDTVRSASHPCNQNPLFTSYLTFFKSLFRFAHTNPLHLDIFQSVAQFEAEVVAMTAALLGNKEKASGGQVCGNMTSGGTESILLAVKSSRDYMRNKKGITRPEMYGIFPTFYFHFSPNEIITTVNSSFSKYRIIPVSAHSAYDKAAQYFNIKLRRVSVDKEFRADVKAIKKHINRNTILVWIFTSCFGTIFHFFFIIFSN